MHFAWRFVWLCVGATLTLHHCSGCGIGTILMENNQEDYDNDTILWQSAEITGAIEDNTFFIDDNNCTEKYDHAEAFKVEIERTGGTFKVFFKPGPKYSDYVDISPPRSITTDNTRFSYTCDGERTVAVFGVWHDKNNRAPKFENEAELTFPIDLNWDKNVPLNYGTVIQVSDQDHTLANALTPTFTTSRDDVIRIDATPLFENDASIVPPVYLWDVKIFLRNEYPLKEETLNIDITVADGVNAATSTIPIIVEIVPANTSPPQFSQVSYHHKLENWPENDAEFVPNPAILATDPADPNTPVTYSLESTDVQFINEDDPTRIKFINAIAPTDPRSLIMVEITATIIKGGSPLQSKAALIIELPPRMNPRFTAEAEFVRPEVDWDVGDPRNITVPNALIEPWAAPTFSIASVYPPELRGNFELVTTTDNSVHITYSGITEESDIPNNVVLITIEAQVGNGNNARMNSATMALYFPEKSASTTEPPRTTTECPTPTWTTDVTGSCPPCSTDTPTTPEPIECTTIMPTTCEPTDCPVTPDPSTGTCPPCVTTIFPTTTDCPTEPSSCAPCPTEPSTCPTEPSSCPTESSSCAPCPTEPSSCPTEPSSCAPCPTEPSSCPTEPSSCPTEPSSCPTEPSSCPTEPSSCAPCPTGPSSCAPCPTEPSSCPTEPSTCTPCENCNSTATTVFDCPSTFFTCPEPTTCPDQTECPTSCPPPTPCPTTPRPTVPTCPTIPPTTPCPTTCPPPTTPCPTTCPPPTECPTCPPNREDCEPCSESSNTGLVAGVIAVSVLLVGSLGLAGFLYMKWKSASSFSSYGGNGNAAPSNNTRFSFAQPETSKTGGGNFGEDNGWVNPTFNSAEPSTSALEQVLTHPEPSTSSAALASPYMTAPVPGMADSQSPIKSSLAKPKEIAPDYEEGLNRSPPGGDSNATTNKPKTGGVKIADEVEIINSNDKENLIHEVDDERL